MFKGAIFDLDGVITDTSRLHFLAWKETLAKYNIPYDENINNLFKGLPRHETLLAILKLKSLPNKFSIRQIEKICEEKNDLYVKKINFIDEKNIYPRIQNFIQSLNKHNVKLALASSSQNAKTILKQLNLISFFDYLVDPITIKNPKPAPDIYIAATKGLHLSPNECIGIEDAIVGIEGLQAANIFTVGIDYGVKPVQLKSDISFATPSDISLDKIIKAYEKQKK